MDEILKLLACIVLPGAASIVIIKLIFTIINTAGVYRDKNFAKLSPFSLDADRGLAEQGYLWLSILAPLLYFFALGHYSWQGYTLSMSSTGLSEFLRISTLPIGLISLSIPLSILVSRIHATHQTSVQITTTRYKNNMDGYYAHRKAIFEYFGSQRKITYLGVIVGDFHAYPRLHLRFFKDEGPSNGTPKINTQRFTSAIALLTEIQLHIHYALLSTSASEVATYNYANACTKIYDLAGILTLPCIYEELKNSSDEHILYDTKNLLAPNDLKFIKLGQTTDSLIGSYRYTRSFMRVLCEFAGYDVSFFDKKEYPVIDKGDKYNSHPYNYRDISSIINFQNDSNKIISARREAKEKVLTSES